MRLQATIGGTVMAPLLRGSTINLSIDQRVDTAQLIFVTDDPTSIDAHDSVVITELETGSANKYFSGLVTAKTSKFLKPGVFEVTCRCASTAWLLGNPPQLITEVYRDVDDQDIIIDLISKAGLSSDITATTSTVDTVETGLTIAFRERTAREAIEEVAAASGAVWSIDADDVLHYNATSSAAAAHWGINQNNPNNNTTYAVQDLQHQENFEKPITDATVLGTISPTGTQISATSSATSPPRRFARSFESPLILSADQAQAVADAYVAQHEVASDSISFDYTDLRWPSWRFPNHVLLPNTRINTYATEYGIAGQLMLIRSVKMVQKTGDETWYSCTAGGYLPTEAELIRRIEAGSKRNQQLLPFAFFGYNFDGVNDYVDIPDHASLQFSSPFTISMWVMPDAFSGHQTLIRKRNSSAGAGWELGLNDSSGRILAKRETNLSDVSAIAATTLTAGQLYHIAAVFQSASVTIYLNGTSDGSDNGSGTPGSDAGMKINIGYNYDSDNNGDFSEPFNGFISDVRIWNGALPPNLIRRLASKPGAEESLWGGDKVLHLKFDEYGVGEGVGTTNGNVRDSSNAMNHGRGQGVPTGREEVWQ